MGDTPAMDLNLELKEDNARRILLMSAADAGDKIEEWFEPIIQHPSDPMAAKFMGIFSGILCVNFMISYFVFNRFIDIKVLRITFWVALSAYLPECIIFISAAFWNIEMVRRMFKI